MSGQRLLDDVQFARVGAVAELLLAGPSDSPPPGALPEFGELVQQATRALGRESTTLEEAIAGLPAELSPTTVERYAVEQPAWFELLSLVVVGAYFMSPAVRTALGLPTGERRAAPRDLAVDELSSGLLDAVLERGSPVKTLAQVAGRGAPTA